MISQKEKFLKILIIQKKNQDTKIWSDRVIFEILKLRISAT